jgi:CheY-like chemotaxis protein
MKIMCVDDSPVFRKTIQKQLEALGHTKFVEHDNITDAANHLEQDSEIGLVILDHHIPSGNGLDLLNWMRNHPSKRILEIPCVMLTGDADRDLPLQATESGASGFMFKPVELETLKNQLQRVMK